MRIEEWFRDTPQFLVYLPIATIGELQKFVERD